MAIVPISGITIPRQSVANSQGLFTKMFDPPTDSPPTPDALNLAALPVVNPPWGIRPNPVPSVMQAAGYLNPVAPFTVTRSLMHGMAIPTWDAGTPTEIVKELVFFLFQDDDLLGGFNDPQFPAPTVRAPRGAIFHGFSQGQGPPPHTIHWHGIEPTPMNDGVGHCSMEIGQYTYQWQANFIGTYFYHCHRNTMQHFEFGLYGLMLFHPPDAFFASIATIDPVTGIATLNGIPIGHGRPETGFPLGRFRTAANLANFPQFPGFVGGSAIQGVATPDPLGQFQFDPHAFTVPYDVECLWVLDDRDSVWSENGSGPRDTFPAAAFFAVPPVPGFVPVPGVNDNFQNNPGRNGFFNFNDYNADYWFITGVPVPAYKGGSATLATGLVVPPQLNSGVSGSRIDIQANRGETVFIRCLDAAYNWTRVTMPVDMLIIEWDGRALGVPPLNRYNRPIFVPANTPITHSTARRWGAIVNVPLSADPVHSVAKVEFLDQRSVNTLTLTGGGDVVMTAFIPVNIN